MPAPMLPKKFRKFKPFAQRVEDGDICNVAAAAKILGFTEFHVRRLCHEGGLGHEKRGSQFWFRPEHLEKVTPNIRAGA